MGENTCNMNFYKQHVTLNVLTNTKHIAMQYNNEECVDILKRLITANKDRIYHYSEAIQFLDTDRDVDLITKFEELAQQSQQFKAQLTPLIYREGDSEAHGDCLIKTELQALDPHKTAANREKVLLASEHLEAEIKLIYHEVDNCNEIIEEQTKELIRSQSQLLEVSYTEITDLLKSE